MAGGHTAGGRLEIIEVVHTTPTRRVTKAFDRDLRQVVSVTTEALRGRDGVALLAELEPYLDLPSSPALAALLDARVTDDDLVMVSPWVEGVDLLTLLEASGTPGLPVTAVLEWLDQVGDALRHLEGRGLRHGDVRPANLVLTSEQRVIAVGLGTGVLDDDHQAVSRTDVRGLAATAAALLTGSAPSVGAITGTAAVSGAALQRALLPALDERADGVVGVDQLLETLRHELNAGLPTGVVTFLLTDIAGSTQRWESDESTMATELARHDLLMAESAEAAGGRLLKARGEGDATFSVFTRASAGVAAAVAAQRRLAAETGLVVRMAVHTGEAELREADYFGRTVNRAARLRSIAPEGGIVVSGATADLIADALPAGVQLVDRGTVVLKDLERPERVYEVRPVDPPSGPERRDRPVGAVASAAPSAPAPPSPVRPSVAPIPAPTSSRPRRRVVAGALVGAVLTIGAVLAVVVTGGGSASGTGPTASTAKVAMVAKGSSTTAAPAHLDDSLLQARDLPPGITLRHAVPYTNANEACGQESVDLVVPAADKVAFSAQDPTGGSSITEDLRRFSDTATATRAEALLVAAFDCPSVSIANASGQRAEGAVSPRVDLAQPDGTRASYRSLDFNGFAIGVEVARQEDETVIVQYATFVLTGDALRHQVTELMARALARLSV